MFPDPHTIPDPLARAHELRRQAEIKLNSARQMLTTSEPLWMLLVSPRDRIGDPNVWSSRKSKRHWEEAGHWLERVRQDRELVPRMIEEAAAYQSETQPEARFLLVLLYNREKRYDDALRVLEGLKRDFPGNRFLWLNEGTTQMRAGRIKEAEAAFNTGIARLASDARPRAFGEESLWYYRRGAARLQLQRAQSGRRPSCPELRRRSSAGDR